MNARRRAWGAEVGAAGTRFRVLAPGRERVEVVVEDGRATRTFRLEPEGATGVWRADAPDVGAGALYRYRLAGEDDLLPDPTSRFQPQGVAGPSEVVDPTFAFMTLDWDGRIRMDPSSPYAMQRLIGLKDRYDLSFACDTDHDRHGIVCPGAGLLPSNHYLAVMIDYLFTQRAGWSLEAAVGKTVVSSALIDRVCATRLGRKLYEVPVGFKWYVDGLLAGNLGFGGEESAGATFLRIDGTPWTTDKDGIVAALLSAEITARCRRNPAQLYDELTQALGTPFADRVEAPATPAQKQKLAKLSPPQVRITELAGEPIGEVLDRAPGNGAPIGGIKVVAPSGWFAARPSGTEDIYKIYAESFRGADHLRILVGEAQHIVDVALRGS